ncbi:uncharacterized protein VTP21DRAFT_2488 [Calcarisporiella thermophila]|uniref:uncharacterized protein n=1 Tax=Calcarisporiella thermophila TaxID=911321 RepID=UPI0037445951
MSLKVTTIQNFIGGAFTTSSASNTLESYNPATGEVIARFPDSTPQDVDQAVAAARRAFPAWSATPRWERARILLRVADLVEERLEELAKAETCDQGKSITASRTLDIPRVAYNFRFFGTKIMHILDVTVRQETAQSQVQRRPVGVAALISPWNFPLYLLTTKIAACLATGNTCVCKPSEFTPLTAYLFCSILKEAGVPDGVVNMVFGTGSVAGNALVVHPDVPLVSFTGGTTTGRKITEASAQHFKRLSLELGGKNAFLAFEDCDLEKCLTWAIKSAYGNSGQACVASSRIFVQKSIWDRFVPAFIERTRAIKVGDPLDPSTELGPLNSTQHLERVLSYVALAKSEGGKIECGGDRLASHPNGCFLVPTVITGLGPKTRTMQEEIFGPVVCIAPFETEEEAIELANGTKFGLSCCVFTENGARQRRVSEKVHAGSVWVNCFMARDLSMPFGGFKQSGIGREGGEWSIDFFTETKCVCFAD